MWQLSLIVLVFLLWRLEKFFEFFEKQFCVRSSRLLTNKNFSLLFLWVLFIVFRSSRRFWNSLKSWFFLICFLSSRRFWTFRRVFLLICFLRSRRFSIFCLRRFFIFDSLGFLNLLFVTLFNLSFFFDSSSSDFRELLSLRRFREFVHYRFSKIFQLISIEKMWIIFQILEKFALVSENFWILHNFNLIRNTSSLSHAKSYRITNKSYFAFRAQSRHRLIWKIIEKRVNAVKQNICSVNRYVQKFALIVLSLTIRNHRDNSFLRRWQFVKIRKSYWSMLVRSTNEIISSILFFVFACFVVVMSFERITSFSWRTFSTFVKRHVLNCSIYKQKKKRKIFFQYKFFFKTVMLFL